MYNIDLDQKPPRSLMLDAFTQQEARGGILDI